ncbi:hypothetical protein [Pseudonocardia sp. DLS-67]
MAAGLILGSGTAIAAPSPAVPVASTVPSGGGTGGDACAQMPAGMQDLLCPSADGEDQAASDSGGGAAAGGSGGGSAPAGGTTGTAATPGASGSGAPAAGGPVSNFLTWLAGLFQGVGL